MEKERLQIGYLEVENRPTVMGTGVLLSGEAAAVDLSTTVRTTGNQSISGQKTFVDNTDFKQNISVSGFYNFDITNTGVPLDGQMNWNPDYGTAQIGMNAGNVINPVGFKSFYRVKASENIRKGKVVMALGGVGNSEYILAREAQNIGNSGQLIMGVSAEEILANNYGDVVAFGSVRGVNTSTYPQDSILYYDPLSTGGFTNIPPEAPNVKVTVALNTTSNNNGIVFVRVTAGSELGGTDSNVKFSNLQNSDIIIYNSGSGLWLNSGVNFGSFYTNDNPSGFITGIDISSFYPSSNPSGYITGVDLSNYVTGLVVRPEETGNFYTNNNPSGFITNSSVSKIIDKFTASSNQPPATGFATLDTRNSIAVLDFIDTSTESAVFVGIMPESANLSSGVIVRLIFMATTATSGDVRWSVALERGNTDLDTDSFDTAVAANVAVNGTSGIPSVAEITVTTIDGIVAGDLYRLRVQRIGGDGADTATGDAELIAVEVRSAA